MAKVPAFNLASEVGIWSGPFGLRLQEIQVKLHLGVGHPIRKDKGIFNMGRLRFAFIPACIQFTSVRLDTTAYIFVTNIDSTRIGRRCAQLLPYQKSYKSY